MELSLSAFSSGKSYRNLFISPKFLIAFLFLTALSPTTVTAQETARVFSLGRSCEEFLNFTDYVYSSRSNSHGSENVGRRGCLEIKTGKVNYDYAYRTRIDSALHLFTKLSNHRRRGISINGGDIRPIDFVTDIESVERFNNFLVIKTHEAAFLLPISLNMDSIQQFERILVSKHGGIALRKNRKYAISDKTLKLHSDFVYDNVTAGKRGWSVKQGSTFRYVSFKNETLLDNLDDLYSDGPYGNLHAYSNWNGRFYKYIDFSKNIIWEGPELLLAFKEMLVTSTDPATKKIGVKKASGQTILPSIYSEVYYSNRLLNARGTESLFFKLDGTEFPNIHYTVNDSTYLTMVDKKIGIVDSDNKEIFAPQFDQIDGQAVRIGELYGCLSHNLRTFYYPLAYQYIDWHPWSSLLYVQKDGTDRQLVNRNKKVVYTLKDSEFVEYGEQAGEQDPDWHGPDGSFEGYLKAQTYLYKKLGQEFIYRSIGGKRYIVTEAGLITSNAAPLTSGQITAGRDGSQSPQTDSYTAVYSADSFGNRGTKILYYVRNGVVYAADEFNNRTNRILRHIVGDKVYAAHSTNGNRTNTILYYIVNNIVYAADLNSRQRTNTPLEYISGNVIYAADASSGQKTDRKLRYVEGAELTN
ncbi:hypothetical protein D9M72_324720 [compost metagenome]